MNISVDLVDIEHQDIVLADIQVADCPPKELEEFKDPYFYKEDKPETEVDNEASQAKLETEDSPDTKKN